MDRRASPELGKLATAPDRKRSLAFSTGTFIVDLGLNQGGLSKMVPRWVSSTSGMSPPPLTISVSGSNRFDGNEAMISEAQISS
jgi:hypothetical protein